MKVTLRCLILDYFQDLNFAATNRRQILGEVVIKLLNAVVMVLLIIPTASMGQILLSGNFDNLPDFNVDQYPPSPWPADLVATWPDISLSNGTGYLTNIALSIG